MGFFKKVFKGIKKVAKVAAPIALAGGAGYLGYKAFQSMTAPSLFPAGADPKDAAPVGMPSMNWGNALGAAASLGSGALSYIGQRDANAANAQQAQKQMDFQADQSGTSWQRGIADMKAAGLNPMLAYSQGGASSMGGSTARMENTLEPAVSSARQTAFINQQLRNMYEQNSQIAAQTRLIEAQEPAVRAQANLTSTTANAIQQKLSPEIDRIREGSENLSADTYNKLQTYRRDKESFEADVRRRKADAGYSEASEKIANRNAAFAESDLGAIAPYIESILGSGSSAASIFRMLSPRGR